MKVKRWGTILAVVLLVGHNPGGLFRSDDLGASWSKGTSAGTDPFALPLSIDSGELTPEAPFWELASGGKSVFAGASAGI